MTIILIIIVFLTFYPFCMHSAMTSAKEAILLGATVEGDHLRFPAPRGLSHFVRLRRTVPLLEVGDVRLALGPDWKHERSLLTTTRGETFAVPRAIFYALERHPAFSRKGIRLIGGYRSVLMPPLIAKHNLCRAAAYVAFVVIFPLALPMVYGGMGHGAVSEVKTACVVGPLILVLFVSIILIVSMPILFTVQRAFKAYDALKAEYPPLDEVLPDAIFWKWQL